MTATRIAMYLTAAAIMMHGIFLSYNACGQNAVRFVAMLTIISMMFVNSAKAYHVFVGFECCEGDVSLQDAVKKLSRRCMRKSESLIPTIILLTTEEYREMRKERRMYEKSLGCFWNAAGSCKNVSAGTGT